MSAGTQHPSYLSALLECSRTLLQRSLAVWLLATIVVVALAAFGRTALAATTPSATDTAMTPALRLAVGTLQLEDTGQAIDAAAAAQLLPLWQLLAELNTSSSTAPQEISAVVDEIKLNMTSAQVKAIESMTISQDQLQTSSAGPAAAAGVTSQASSAVGGPMLGGEMGAGGPPAGSMPLPSSQRSNSTSSASTVAATPAAIQDVIELLESKLPSG